MGGKEGKFVRQLAVVIGTKLKRRASTSHFYHQLVLLISKLAYVGAPELTSVLDTPEQQWTKGSIFSRQQATTVRSS
jgi:hypothetical protein